MPKTAARRRNDTPVSDELRAVIDRNGGPSPVARAAGLSASVLLRFVNHERGLTIDTLDRIASAYGLKLVETRRPRSVAPAPRRGAATHRDRGEPEP